MLSDELLPSPTVQDRSEQDQTIANLITDALEFLEIIRENPSIADLISGRGYDATRLEEGHALQHAAQDTFTQRQTAIYQLGQASASLKGVNLAARETYADFRFVARAVYPQSPQRSALALQGEVPEDREKFITTARASYDASLQEPYASELTHEGYPLQLLEQAGATLDALVGANEKYNSAAGEAKGATSARNAAAKELEKWMRKLRRVTTVATKKEPALAKKLKL